MKRLSLILGLVLWATLPAGAAEIECVTVHIGHDATGLIIEGADNPLQELTHAETGGPYLAFTWATSDDSDNGRTDTLSFDVGDPTVESITACTDGSVTIEHANPEPEPDNTRSSADTGDQDTSSSQPDEAVTPIGVCQDNAETLQRYCTLPNLTLIIS